MVEIVFGRDDSDCFSADHESPAGFAGIAVTYRLLFQGRPIPVSTWIQPFKSWFDGLDAQAAAKVTRATLKLELGNTSSVKWIGKIGEHRIDWGPGYRIYCGRDGEELTNLLAGRTKKRQQKDIARVERFFAEYKSRKAMAIKVRVIGKDNGAYTQLRGDSR